MKFQIARTPTWRWLLSLMGGTASRSYLELQEDVLEVRFGGFHQRIPLAEIRSVSVHRRTVPWYLYSIGWRANFAGGIGLIGAAENIVRLELATARRVNLVGLPLTCRELFVSLEQPDRFVGALAAAGVARPPAQPRFGFTHPSP